MQAFFVVFLCFLQESEYQNYTFVHLVNISLPISFPVSTKYENFSHVIYYPFSRLHLCREEHRKYRPTYGQMPVAVVQCI